MERNPPLSVPEYTTSQPQQGAALLLALFALAAISHLSLRLVTHALGYRHLLRTYTDSISHHYSLRNDVSPMTSHNRDCEIQQLRGGGISGSVPHRQEWFVCSTGRMPFLSSQHVQPQLLAFDYSALFKNHGPCLGQRSNIALTTFTTPMTAFTCLLPPRLGNFTTLLENIAIESATMAPSTQGEVNTVATPGSLNVTSGLSVPGNSLLVAGGDVRIPILRLFHSQTAEVTIISAHGDILVERIEGAISLLALSRRVISVPQTPPPHAPPLPPLRRPSVSGIIPR